MFKEGDRVKPIGPEDLFSAGVVVKIGNDVHRDIYMMVQFDTPPPAEYCTCNPAIVEIHWFERDGNKCTVAIRRT